MNRKRLLLLLAIVGIAVLVAVQVTNSSINRSQFIASADIPTVAPGVDVLAGIALIPLRIRSYDYRRDAFGDSWTDDNPAPGGHNGCDTRNDILDRDLVDKSYVSIKRCPTAVATGLLHDPYTNAEVAFTRGEKTGAAVQIDHIVPLALAWDLGARFWTDDMRLRFANDPANLIAVAGGANQDKGDHEPATWMPPNTAFRCQYAIQFIAVLRGYALPIDAPSAAALRDAASTLSDRLSSSASWAPSSRARLSARVGLGVRPETGAVVQPVEGGHVVVAQLEVEHVDIRLDPLR